MKRRDILNTIIYSVKSRTNKSLLIKFILLNLKFNGIDKLKFTLKAKL